MSLVIPREAFEHRLAVLQGQRFRLDAQIAEVEFWLRETEEPPIEEPKPVRKRTPKAAS